MSESQHESGFIIDLIGRRKFKLIISDNDLKASFLLIMPGRPGVRFIMSALQMAVGFFGKPDVIYTDRAKEFTGPSMEMFCRHEHIRHEFIKPQTAGRIKQVIKMEVSVA